MGLNAVAVGAAPAGHHMDRMPERAEETSPKPCPICGKPAVEHFRPFCSKRCVDVDLHRWLAGVYAVPAQEDDEDDERPAAKPADEAS